MNEIKQLLADASSSITEYVPEKTHGIAKKIIFRNDLRPEIVAEWEAHHGVPDKQTEDNLILAHYLYDVVTLFQGIGVGCSVLSNAKKGWWFRCMDWTVPYNLAPFIKRIKRKNEDCYNTDWIDYNVPGFYGSHTAIHKSNKTEIRFALNQGPCPITKGQAITRLFFSKLYVPALVWFRRFIERVVDLHPVETLSKWDSRLWGILNEMPHSLSPFIGTIQIKGVATWRIEHGFTHCAIMASEDNVIVTNHYETLDNPESPEDLGDSLDRYEAIEKSRTAAFNRWPVYNPEVCALRLRRR